MRLATTLIAVVSALSAVVAAQGSKAVVAQGRIAVYVFTDQQSRIPTVDEANRQETARTLEHYLSGRKNLLLTENGDLADVRVRVFSAVELFSPREIDQKPFDERAVTVEVSGGGTATRYTESALNPKRTVHKLADRIERWIEANRAKILAERAKRGK